MSISQASVEKVKGLLRIEELELPTEIIVLNKELGFSFGSPLLPGIVQASRSWSIPEKRRELTEIMRAVLASGKRLDPNAQKAPDMPALHVAASRGRITMLRLILRHPEVDVNAQDSRGWTALMMAVSRLDIQIVKVLLARPEIDLSLETKTGMTAMDMSNLSRRKGAQEILKMLKYKEVAANWTDLN